ncbi:MAG: DNA polymerase III subunit delta [Candidatus Pelagibacterales bacterium]|jgi:DNA polymerase-3 subunit delta
MLIKQNQLLSQIYKENINYQPILLYGPNEGLIRENLIKIKSELKKFNAEEISFSGKSINEQPENFNDEIQTISMFSNKKIIIIEQPIDRNVDLFESTFKNLPENTLIVVIADNLKKLSKIRKFFETSSQYMACANYDDDLKTNSQQISELEKKIQKVFDKDIKNYLNQHLSNNRMISNNEIDKIILLYFGSNKDPKLHEIKSIFNDNADLGINKISEIVFSGNPNKTSIFLSKIFAEGINAITIIRTMINYVQRVQTTQIALKKTNNFDNAIKSLKPPVFWKDKDLFKLHCIKWPINETVLNFDLLVNAELKCKSDYNLTNILCERALIKIANKGKKYFN